MLSLPWTLANAPRRTPGGVLKYTYPTPFLDSSMDGLSPRVRRQLPTALQLRILTLLPPNDRALSGRLVSPDAADGLCGAQHCTACLSQPLPLHAVAWSQEAGQQHMRQLTFNRKLQLLCTAAASGAEVNLEVALALLQPSVFPGLLQRRGALPFCPDPGVAAVKAGHPQVLGWLLRRCPGVVSADQVLEAAASHCDVAGLQAAWATLVDAHRGSMHSRPRMRRPVLGQGVLDSAAGAPAAATLDAVAKVAWILATSKGWCRLKESTAEAAACSGDLGRLQWLHDRGCPVGGCRVLACALEHADLVAAQWLVDVAGCELPAAGDDEGWDSVLDAAASSPDGVMKLQWLQQHGAPALQDQDGVWLLEHAAVAAEAGQLDVVRYLQAAAGLHRVVQMDPRSLGRAAAASGSVPMAELVLQAGATFRSDSFHEAICSGNMAMLRWLLSNAAPSEDVLRKTLADITDWPDETPAHARELMEAVQLVLGVRDNWRDSRDLTNEVLHGAAYRGDLTLLQYVHGRLGDAAGPEWLQVATDAAACGGCEAVLEWLVTTKGRCVTASPYLSAAKNGDLGTLTVLRRLGVQWGVEDVIKEAEKEHSVQALEWLRAHGAPEGLDEEDEQCEWYDRGM